MFQQNEAIVPEQQSPETASNNQAEQAEVKTTEKHEEVSVVQEQPTVTQVPVQVATDDDQNQTVVKPADEAEVKEEFSSKVEKGERIWAHQVKTVIKEYEDEPYTEEEAAEDLQVKYLDQRFGVKINKKEHQAK